MPDTSPQEPNSDGGKKGEGGRHMRMSPMLVVILIAFGVWAYFGFPSPNTLMNWPSAEQDCVKFAEEHKGELFFISGSKIRAVSSWMKNGKIVVEIGAFRGDEATYFPRICVVGGGTIQIVSVLESGAWR